MGGTGIIRGLAVGLLLALGACGWTPLYADRETGPADEELRAIKVSPIAERIGQRLELALRNSLNPEGIPTPQKYVLATTLQTVRSDLGVQSTGIGTRGKLDVIVAYALIDSKSNVRLVQNSLHVAESFDIVANEYASVVAEDDARNRAIEQLRLVMVTRLTLFLQHRVAEGQAPGAR